MAKEPSAKRPHGGTSDQTSKVDDVKALGQNLNYPGCLKEVDIHGKEKLDVVCTSNPYEADKMINRIRKRIGGLYHQYISVDVEYTREDEPPQRAEVQQLCVEQLFLVYHITVETKWPKGLHLLLKQDKLYTFAGFSTEGDKHKLQESGLEINPNKYIHIQCKWRVPFMGRKRFHSLADVAGSVIHPFYNNKEKKIDREENQKLWGDQRTARLPHRACSDRKLKTREGLEGAKAVEEIFDNHYYGSE